MAKDQQASKATTMDKTYSNSSITKLLYNKTVNHNKKGEKAQ